MNNKNPVNKIEAKNIIIATLAILIVVVSIVLVIKKNAPEKTNPNNTPIPVVKKEEPIKKVDVPEITREQLTEEEIKATDDFAKKVAPKE